VALLVASRYALFGYSERPTGLGSTPNLDGSFVSRYSDVCIEIKLLGSHTGFDGVLFKL